MKRLPQIDLLRGVAVSMVVAFHYSGTNLLTRAGWLGVELFFVISGFLISGLLFEEIRNEGTISAGRFLLRRGFRIYPPYYFFLAVAAAVDPQFHSHHYLGQIFFLQNYIVVGPWVHTWSLGVEEHFYLAIPFVLLLLNRFRRLHWIPVLAVALSVVCLLMRLYSSSSETTVEDILFPTHLRADALFLGVALGYLYSFEADRLLRFSRWYLLPLAVALLMFPITHPRDLRSTVTWGLPLASFGFAAILLWSIGRSWLRHAVLEEIGTYSYSVYLWHPIVLAFVPKGFGILSFVGCLVLAVAIGVSMALVVEVPSLALRERFVPGRSGRSIPAEPCVEAASGS